MKKTKESDGLRYTFLAKDTEDRITLSLDVRAWKSTAEITVNGQCAALDEPLFSADYWIKAFEHEGARYLIVVKELLIGTDYEVDCYRNGRSLTDDSTLEDLRRRISDPYDPTGSGLKRVKIKKWIAQNIGTLIAIAAIGVIRLAFHWQDPWQENVRFLIFLIVFVLLITVLPAVLKKRGRKLLLRDLSENSD